MSGYREEKSQPYRIPFRSIFEGLETKKNAVFEEAGPSIIDGEGTVANPFKYTDDRLGAIANLSLYLEVAIWNQLEKTTKS